MQIYWKDSIVRSVPYKYLHCILILLYSLDFREGREDSRMHEFHLDILIDIMMSNNIYLIINKLVSVIS